MKRDMVAGLIIRDRKLLLVHNTKHGGFRVEPPGGKKRGGEGWEEAVVREVREEIGVTVRPTKLFGIYDTDSPEGGFSVHMFFCDMTGGEPSIVERDKISGFGWYSFGDMVRLKEEGSLVPNMCRALPELKRFL
jgi:8-oxo-dGTP diphosphatase